MTVSTRLLDRFRKRYLCIALVWCHLSLSSGRILPAQQIVDSRREYKVKAVFLYSFGRFTTWPDQSTVDASESFTIGVMGQSQIRDSLARIARKRNLNGIPIKIKQYNAIDKIDDDCRIVFVSQSVEPQDAAELFNRLGDRPVLTVTETSQHRNSGVVINFTMNEDSVHFEINNKAANRKKLNLDARLLRQGRRMNL